MKSSNKFNRFLQKPRFRVQCTELSPELATQIIEKEIEMDKTVTLALIQELTLLYTEAVEHYESQENPKYLDFQEKIQKMLVRPQVLAVINPKPSGVSPRKSLSPCKRPFEEHRKHMSMQLSSNLQASNLMNVINSQSTKTKETSENLRNVIKSQEKDLESKLMARRNKKELRSQSESLNANQVFNCDVSYVEQESNSSTKSSLIISQDIKESHEKYEKRLEEIMEKNFNELALRVMEVRERYEKEIEDICSCEGFGEMIVKEMRKNMENDIEELKGIFEAKRKKEILAVREEINN